MYAVKQGNDGLFYAVFNNTDDAWDWFLAGNGFQVACFDQYENAILLSETWGM